ncbi:MAG: hypothetical protein ABW099_03885 [Candidatus Binatia bacterium]
MDSERTIELAAERTGLIIVDMQAEGCERHGPGLKPVIQNIRSLLNRFREAAARSSTSNRSGRKIIPSLLSLASPTLFSTTVPPWSLSTN